MPAWELVPRDVPKVATKYRKIATAIPAPESIPVMQTLRQSTGIRARDLDGVDNYEYLGNTTGTTIFNTTKPPLDDVRVRHALVLAQDQEQLIEVQGGTGVVPPSTQIFSQDSPYYSEEVANAWPTYDPDRRATMDFGATTNQVLDDPAADERVLWDGVR